MQSLELSLAYKASFLRLSGCELIHLLLPACAGSIFCSDNLVKLRKREEKRENYGDVLVINVWGTYNSLGVAV